MSNFFIPTKDARSWQSFLAEPTKQWQPGKSAMALAACWEQFRGFPDSIKDAFDKSNCKLFHEAEILLALPEYKVALVGSNMRPSQNDIFVLAKGDNQLIAIAVEGKVQEPFAEPVYKWKKSKDEKTNKPERLKFLLEILGLSDKEIEIIGYQLLHRTVSAILSAKKFLAPNALMLVHSFCQEDEKDHFSDYANFLNLFNLKAERNRIIGFVRKHDVNLYFGWVRGERKYLDIDLRKTS